MATPSSAMSRWDASLNAEEFSLEMNRRKYIGPAVLKPRMTAQQSASYGLVSIEALLRSHTTKRTARSGYGRDLFEGGQASFATEEYGWEATVDDREAKIYRDLLDQERIAIGRAVNIVCDEYERDVASAVFNTGTWTGAALTSAAAVAWSTAATATPILDVVNAADKVALGCGEQPNALVINWRSYMHLLYTAEIRGALGDNKDRSWDELGNAVAGLLGLERIIVAGGMKNTANENQTASVSRIWSGSYAMVCKVARTDDPKEICVGRTFMFADENAPMAAGSDSELAVIIEEYRDDKVRGNVYRARNDRQVKILYPEAGHLITGIV